MSAKSVTGADPAKKSVTIQDVAALARVSIATVSRVLNNSGTVDEELAGRVRAACTTLQYRPNRAARALAGGRPVLIGFVVGDLLNPFFVEMIEGIEDTMRRFDYLLVLCNSAKDPIKERQYIDVLCAERVAGVIIVPDRQRHLALFRQHGIPVVTVDQRAHDRSIDSVLIDNVAAAREAVAHLIANGYRRIGIISGPSYTTTGHGRLEGYRLALHDAGIAHEARIERSGAFTEQSGLQFAHELLDVTPSIDALLTGNNRITLGALKALHARGLRVPHDIGLVGFDNVPWVTPGTVALTTVIQPAYELGRTAAMRLVQRLEHPGEAVRQEIVLAHHLQIGESSLRRASVSQTYSDGGVADAAPVSGSLAGETMDHLAVR